MKNHVQFVGIDVSKNTLDVCVMTGSSEGVEYAKFDNTSKGFSLLRKWVGKQPSLYCMEHTGVYTMPLCTFLASKKIDYSLVPALVIKRSLGLQRGKSDKADARSIARFALRFKDELELYSLPDEKLMELKLLLNNRDRLLKAKGLLKIPAKECADFISKKLVPSNTKAINAINKEIAEMDNKITALIKSDEQLDKHYRLLNSVPGVGPQIAANLLVVTRCFTQFKDARKLACYCGVAPFEYSSGTSIKGRSRVSPFANKKMKSILNMGALNAKRHDAEIRIYYERKKAEGKNGMLIMNAIRNKLLHRIVAVVNRGTPFVPLAKFAT